MPVALLCTTSCWSFCPNWVCTLHRCNKTLHTFPEMLAGVKDAVVDAVEELYLKAPSGGSTMDPRQAAQNLVGLTQGSSLGTAPTSRKTV